ncbi:hypothetical protein [Bryobacter aggregatus]|uniref:hypothetical protein n=1 Tax=Bryobacter aggregatus TaxID=360054 RepID=UPI0004E1B774|nr:hypothetical protein [Bryobacter aggregatus]
MTPAEWSWIPDWWLPHLETLIGEMREPSFDGVLLARYTLQALLTSAPIWLADFLFGLGLLRLLKLRLAGGLRIATALALGMGVAGTGIFFFGVFGRLTGKGLLAFTIIQGLLGLWWSRGEWPRLRWRWSYLLLLLLVPNLMLPVIEYDSTMYHMAAAKWYMLHHKIVYHEGIRFNAQPHLSVLLYMRQWWLTQDANLIKLQNLEYVAILLGIFHWQVRRYRVRWGMLAALGFVFGAPIFSYIVQQEYADLALTAFLSAGVSLLLARGGRWHRNRLLAAGLLLGFAAACKLQGLVAVGSFVLADLVVFFWKQRSLPLVFSRAVLLGGGVVAAGAGWWARSWKHTGSPVFPFLTSSPDVPALFEVNSHYGVGRDWLSFLALPWNMIIIEPHVFADSFRFGPAFLILLLFCLIALVLRRRKLDFASLVVALGSILFTLLWFRSGQVMRYEACLLPIWTILLLGSISRWRWGGPVLGLLLLPLLLSSYAMTSNVVRYGVPPPVTWPATQGVLNAVLPYYRATQALSHSAKLGDKVYTWFCDDIRYYAPGTSYGDWFGGYTYTWLGDVHTGPRVQNAVEMLARLKSEGFQYVIVDRDRASRHGSIYGSAFLQTGLAKRFLEIPGTEVLFDDGGYVVFRLL